MLNILILVLIGITAGVLSGMFGVGGGIIIVPALVFFIGMTQHEAQGTSLGLMLLPIGILAAMNYFKSGNLDIRAGLIIAFAFIVGGYFGSKIALGIEQTTLKRIFGVFMLAVSIKLIFFSK
ncbi:MAG: sulfite exporter TauE/SafE family protein [Vicingaceae bacterium]